MTKVVCYFGSFDPDYARNRIIRKGLIANGFKVCICHASGLFPIRYYRLVKSFLKNKDKISSLIVGFPGHYDIPLAFFLGKLFKKQVFFDIFASTYETYILDRQLINPKSLRAKFFFFLDWLGLSLAEYVISDTKAHADFYKSLYNVKNKKFLIVYVGSDDEIFYPRKVREETDVLFYGSYQPLQGTEIIIKAAGELQQLKFKMIGEGQTRKRTEDLAIKLKLKNVEFVNWLSLGKLAEEISKAKITLGIFGDTSKSNIVIPNKVFDYLASAKPIITSSTDAVGELLKNCQTAILIPRGNYSALVSAIVSLMKSKKKRTLAKSGYALFKNHLEAKLVVHNLVSKLNEE